MSLYRGRITVANNKVDMATRLYNLRVLEEKTQKEFAEKIGVTQSCVCSWERRRSTPTREMLLQVCERCNVPIDWFITGQFVEMYR